MNLTDLSCKDFSYELSSKKPVPGGGGVAALAGSLGVALNMMVVNFTKDKKKFAIYEKRYEDILDKAEKLRVELLNLVEKDAVYFEPLSKAYSMPSKTEEEKILKEEEMQKCLKVALASPMETMELVYEGIKLHDELTCIASLNIISDIGVGVLLLKAALGSAYLNVIINTNSINDDEYADSIKKRARILLMDGNEKSDEVFSNVLKKIG